MKRLIVAAAAAIALSGPAMAGDGTTDRDTPDTATTIAASGRQDAGPAFKTAMGPTSAPHLPGGAANGPSDTPATCTPPCPRHHKRAKHRHRSS